MKDTDFAYAVGRVRSNEASLLSASSAEALINASSYDECIKILVDAGFSGIDRDDTEAALSQRLENAFALIYESAPDKSCLDFLVVKNDFHNIKACLKAIASNSEHGRHLVSPSIVKHGLLIKSIEQKDFSLLPEYLASAAEEGYRLVTETLDGQVLEVFLDRKCLEASIMLSKKSGDFFSSELAMLSALLTNIKIAQRCIKTGKDREFTEFALCDCPLCEKDFLCDCVENGTPALAAYTKALGLEKISDAVTKGAAVLEKACDDLLTEKVKRAKYQCLGIAPLAAYYYATDAEIKTVRIILSCKKNGVSVEIIRERVRELYV